MDYKLKRNEQTERKAARPDLWVTGWNRTREAARRWVVADRLWALCSVAGSCRGRTNRPASALTQFRSAAVPGNTPPPILRPLGQAPACPPPPRR